MYDFKIEAADKATLYRDLVQAMEEEELDFSAAKSLAPLPADRRATLLAELRAIKEQTGRFPTVREIEVMVQEAHGHGSLPRLHPQAAAAAVHALEAHGIEFDVKVLHGRRTRLRLVLTVNDTDADAIRALLADLTPDGDA